MARLRITPGGYRTQPTFGSYRSSSLALTVVSRNVLGAVKDVIGGQVTGVIPYAYHIAHGIRWGGVTLLSIYYVPLYFDVILSTTSYFSGCQAICRILM